MEYLQYSKAVRLWNMMADSFKPCYKWNTFNTTNAYELPSTADEVLNLVINGIPSILIIENTILIFIRIVLNLVINGIPSILRELKNKVLDILRF